jgi:potassium-dependent mechanosensitive channel
MLVFVSIFFLTNAHAQQKAEPEKPAPEAAVAAPVPLVDIVTESEALSARLRDIESDLSGDQSVAMVSQQLPVVSREIDGRLRESRGIVAQNPSVEMLSAIETDWRRLRREISALNKQASGRVRELEHDLSQLDQLTKIWEQTLVAAKEPGVPPEVLSRVDSVLQQIRRIHDAAEAQRARALAIQTRVGGQDSRIANALRSIDQARVRVLDHLLLRDSAPIWRLAVRASASGELLRESASSFMRQWAGLGAYTERQAARFALAVVFFGILAACFYRVRRRMRSMPLEQSDPPSPVFDMPLAMALILSVLGSRWVFPQAPRVLWALLGALALAPSVLILRRLLRSELHPLLYALGACFVLDQLRSLTAAVELLPRLFFIGEMILVAGTAIWLVRSAGRAPATTPDHPGSRRLLKFAGGVALAFSFAALIAGAAGYMALAGFAGNTLLRTSFVAVILFAAVEVMDGLAAIALSSRPLGALHTVSRHSPLLRRRIRRVLQLGALTLGVLAALQQLLVRDRLFDAVREFLGAELALGSLRISAGDLLAFGLTVWAAFAVSRFVRFLLDEDIFPRVGLKRGLAYAISHTLHYLILCGGFFLAVAALGVDMTRVTILVGAFSVGVGLGLQNIFNNFISGLILLFERPINIGDMVQIDDASGVVERIGVRASIIRMANGSEIIMPNGKLISERVINWTLSSRQHGIELAITVAQGNDPGHVIKLLEKTAAAHPLVTGAPPPQALVVKLGPDSFTFELRAWTDQSELWMQIRSELAIAVSSTLAAEKIAIR